MKLFSYGFLAAVAFAAEPLDACDQCAECKAECEQCVPCIEDDNLEGKFTCFPKSSRLKIQTYSIKNKSFRVVVLSQILSDGPQSLAWLLCKFCNQIMYKNLFKN